MPDERLYPATAQNYVSKVWVADKGEWNFIATLLLHGRLFGSRRLPCVGDD